VADFWQQVRLRDKKVVVCFVLHWCAASLEDRTAGGRVMRRKTVSSLQGRSVEDGLAARGYMLGVAYEAQESMVQFISEAPSWLH
jgi:hypothetical protein